jgi:hypothetical protein
VGQGLLIFCFFYLLKFRREYSNTYTGTCIVVVEFLAGIFSKDGVSNEQDVLTTAIG